VRLSAVRRRHGRSLYGQQPDQMRRIGVLMARAESGREEGFRRRIP
jgi:hypothetical protein